MSKKIGPTPFGVSEPPSGKVLSPVDLETKPSVLSRWADRVEGQISAKMDAAEKREESKCGTTWIAEDYSDHIRILALCRIAESLG